jgi:hypothetical protein
MLTLSVNAAYLEKKKVKQVKNSRVEKTEHFLLLSLLIRRFNCALLLLDRQQVSQL